MEYKLNYKQWIFVILCFCLPQIPMFNLLLKTNNVRFDFMFAPVVMLDIMVFIVVISISFKYIFDKLK